MSILIDAFNRYRKLYNLEHAEVYPIKGGACSLTDTKEMAIVWIDGRYPDISDGYSLNEICSETINVLFGYAIVEYEGDIFLLGENDSYTITPHTKYSVSGKCIMQIIISPAWDSAQNSFVF